MILNLVMHQSQTIYNVIGLTILSLPIIFRNREDCLEDDNCPFIMKCCVIGLEHYCCTPNNYIQLKPSYLYNEL